MSSLNETSVEPTEEKIKEYLNNKNYENIIKLTRNIFNNNEEVVKEYFIKARFYALLQCEKHSQIIGEIFCLTKKNDKKKQDFRSYFIENYTIIKNKNILYEFLYVMYKLGQYKKLNNCLNYIVEKENKNDYFINVLLSYTNYHLGNFDKCINACLSLSSDKEKQAIVTVNLYSSYLSSYINMLYEYKFVKRDKSEETNNFGLQQIENVKEKIKKITKGIKCEDNDKYELFLNYAIFFTIEKNYEEALQFLEMAENVCRKELTEEEAIVMNIEEIKNTEIRENLWNIEFQRAYIYSKTNKIKDALLIYEKLLNTDYEEEHFNPSLIALSYNNYISLKLQITNSNLRFNKNTNDDKKKEIVTTPDFNISNEKLTAIKTSLFFKKHLCTQLNKNNYRTFEINDCLALYIEGQQADFEVKLNSLVTKHVNYIFIDKLKILMFKKNENYEKCKSFISNIIDRIYSIEQKINFLNAFVTLCFEKKNYKDIILMYQQRETLFQSEPKYYSTFFSNIFYIYICTNYLEQTKEQTKEQLKNEGNLNCVINLFQKYKASIKKDIHTVNYDTLFLVSKYLIYNEKEELLIDLLEFLSNEVKTDIEFFSYISYIYTYINIKNAYKFEDKLKKAVLNETYLIDVEELENRNISADISRTMELNSAGKDRTLKKRKRKKRKNPNADKNMTNYDPERWLSKHEKNSYKKKKKKLKKYSASTTTLKGPSEDSKSQQNISGNVNDKLKNLKSRKKRG